MFLTPASIAFLAQFVFACFLCAFLLRVHTRQSEAEHRSSSLIFFVGISSFALVLGAFFLETALLGDRQLLAIYAENPFVAIGIFISFLFLFAYPAQDQKLRRIRTLALLIAGVFAAWEIFFGFYRSILLINTGQVAWRDSEADIALVALFFALMISFIARSVLLETPSKVMSVWNRITLNKGPYARAYRSISLTFIIPVVMAWVNYEYGREGAIFDATFYYLVFSLGIIATTLLISLAYVNTMPAGFRFRERIALNSLAVVLSCMSILGWVLAPYTSANYEPALNAQSSFLFLPSASDTGYQVSRIDGEFSGELGHNLQLWDLDKKDTFFPIDLGFPFRFFGTSYEQVYISDNGAIAFNDSPTLRSFLGDYRGLVAIVPLYLDLAASQPDGGIFMRKTEDSLTLTWSHVPAREMPADTYTFQIILFADNQFQINYGELPTEFSYVPNAEPESSLMLSGIFCGDPQKCGYARFIAPEEAETWLSRVRANGLVISYYRDYREALSSALWPIALVVVATSGFIVLLQFVFLRQVVDKPIQSLVEGIAQIQEGRMDLKLPIYHGDEIGAATGVFNEMAEQLRTAITDQESQLAKTLPRGAIPTGLTDTQWEILQAVANGDLYKEIARRLHMSERTVKYHMGRILEILNVESRSQAIAIAQPYIKAAGE